MITAEKPVTGALHEKFDVTGMEEDHRDFYISIAASDSMRKYLYAHVCALVPSEYEVRLYD